MQVYLSVTPGEAQSAAKYRRPLAHVAYRIGPESSLLRQSLLLQTRGGLLSVSDREAPEIADPEALCAAVLRECGRRNFQGVLLDFEEPPRPDRAAFASRLGERLAAGRRILYLPESYGAVSPAVTLISGAVSGGSYADYLREAAGRQGSAGHLALDLERLRMDFRLPALTGRGSPLSAQALKELMERESPAVFFSPELCARYFTYARDGQSHFVLFDDAETLKQKMRTATALGFSAAFLMWPEIRDIAEELFSS